MGSSVFWQRTNVRRIIPWYWKILQNSLNFRLCKRSWWSFPCSSACQRGQIQLSCCKWICCCGLSTQRQSSCRGKFSELSLKEMGVMLHSVSVKLLHNSGPLLCFKLQCLVKYTYNDFAVGYSYNPTNTLQEVKSTIILCVALLHLISVTLSRSIC